MPLLFLLNCDGYGAAGPEFEVASVKPNTDAGSRVWLAPPVGGTFTATNVTPRMLITLAWGLSNFEYTGGPAWLMSARYDITAKAPNADPDPERFRLMLRSLLEDRFKLQTHRETREVPVYTLTVAKTGLKLPGMHPEGCAVYGDKSTLEPCGAVSGNTARIDNDKMSMEWLTHVLSNYLGQPVTDKTGFTGSFAVHLEFAPLAGDDSPLPSLFTALQHQGLKLDAQKGPAEVFVIDHAEKPGEN
jgi:uncharacterized protein (TIGR03435 family)